MGRLATRIAIGLLLALIALAPLKPVTGQEPSMPEVCGRLAFSTEEDFVTHGPEPPDGNPYISDGDLLGRDCVICARHGDLLRDFDVVVDLGLDAADVIDARDYLAAFSTELDSPHGDQFTAGDLLVTNGVIIPNVALTHGFQVGHDIGLDGVHLVGEQNDILAFLDAARQYGRNDWLQNPALLGDILDRHAMDIWFSTEGTWMPVGAAGFLDGDVLSARDGVVVAPIHDLLPASVPAGIPNRGVDFGLDALTSGRTANAEGIRFSTEILYEGQPSFSDGDVLLVGNGVSHAHTDLIQCFEPKADFLGLDAFHMMAAEGLPRDVYLPVVLRALGQIIR
jgi:hypothetical protein